MIFLSIGTHAGKVLTHRQLLKSIGEQVPEENHYLRVYIGTTTRKIEPDLNRPKYIITERE
jgi:two-component system KDP operon response regulator KdpE